MLNTLAYRAVLILTPVTLPGSKAEKNNLVDWDGDLHKLELFGEQHKCLTRLPDLLGSRESSLQFSEGAVRFFIWDNMLDANSLGGLQTSKGPLIPIGETLVGIIANTANRSVFTVNWKQLLQ